MMSVYLKVDAAKAGKVKGPVQDRSDKDKDGCIALLAVDHGIASPRDAATGLASGKRQHRPITVTKETDFTSPLFYQFVGTNELLKTVNIFFYGPPSQSGIGAGKETMLYTITLKNAAVAKVEFAGHSDPAAQQSARFPLTEMISLSYESIQWEWKNPAVTAADAFNSKA